MASYNLKQISDSCWTITAGGKKAGFVNACPKGFVGRIGAHCEIADTAKRAFELVAAKALGFSSPEALRANNQEVRWRNSAARQEARYAVDQFLNHRNFEPIAKMLDRL